MITKGRSHARVLATLRRLYREGQAFLRQEEIDGYKQALWSQRLKRYLQRTFLPPQNYIGSFAVDFIEPLDIGHEDDRIDPDELAHQRHATSVRLVKKWLIPLANAIERIELALEEEKSPQERRR